MKKKIKLFLSSIVFICGIFTSCENLLSVKEEKQTEQSYIRISTNLSSVDRSVLPSNYFTKDTTGLTWTLSGSRNGTAEITIKVWNDEGDTAAITQTAYQKMISDSFIPVDEGTWIFTLTAENDSGKVLEATITQTITSGQNILVFDMKEATGIGAASGQIEFTLKWKELSIVDNVAITLSKRNDSSFNNIEVNYEKSTSIDKDYEYVNFFAGTDDSPLEAGSYMLKMKLRQQTGFSDSTEATYGAPIYTTINTYTCLIHVAPGLCSKGEVTLETLAPLYTINYLEEDGTKITSFEENSVPTTYNKYTTFVLPTPKKDGHIFSGWYKRENNTSEKIENINNFSISTNTTLYAKWNLIETWEDITRAVDCVSSTSLPSQPEFIVTNNLTATSKITISNGITLKALDGADEVTITRGAGFTGAFFNNTSTLTLEGITLDGGSTGEISIQAEAPLIISSGSLTLNNCTLQNNTNSNATETGTGIFLQINDTSSLCSFNDVSFGENSSDEIPHIKIENDTGEKFTFNLGGSLAGGVPSIDMPSTTCINISESLEIPDGESIKITLDEYTIGNRIISANEGIDLDSEISNFSLTTTDESWFIDSAGYLVGGSVIAPEISENGEFEVSSFEKLLWIALELKRGSFTSFNIKLTEDIVIESGKWQFYQLNVPDPSTIDGQGHSITIDENVSKFGNDAGGLFYKLNNSTVKKLVLRGSITANTSAGGYIGALCRSAYGSIFENVMSEVTITDNGSGFAGGLIGRLGTSVMYDPTKAMVKNCAVYADVSSTNGIAGGILGAIWENTRCCTIQNSVYMGEIKGTTVGAIVGKNENNDVAESVLNNIWYCVTNPNDSSIPLIGTKAATTEEVITAVESKSAEEIATEAAATLLNTNSDGTSNDVWKYVEGEAAYPTLKIVN